MTTSAGTTDPPALQKVHGLRANALGLPALFAQSLAVISPTMTAVLIIPLAFASAGQGTWLAYAFGTVMLLFVVFCLNQFAKRSAFAGSMYAYTAKGLGPSTGVFSGWTLIWAYYFIAVAGLCGFAVFCGQLLSALGYHGSVHPIFFFALSAVACWVIAYKDIRVSSILTMVLEAASVACITALAFVILFKHGFSVDSKQLSLSGVNMRGMGLAIVACIFSLVGFEAATTMGAEAKNPRRNLPRAVIASLLITGAFMVFMAYVEVGGTSNYGAAWTSAPLNLPRGGLQRELVQDPGLHRRHGELLLAHAVVPQCRLADHVPDGPPRHLLGAPGSGARHQPHAARRGHGVHRPDLRRAGLPHDLHEPAHRLW